MSFDSEELPFKISRWLLEKYGVRVAIAWVQACIKWITEEENKKDINEIRSLVNEQLLHSDLCEVLQQGSLCHKNLQHKGSLEGVYLIQVNGAVDISCPSYNKANKTTKETIKAQNPNRMLLMDVTDGETDFKLMEYQHIPDLDVDLKPGTKLLVKGNMKYNLGILMAQEKNISRLGGSTECIFERSPHHSLVDVSQPSGTSEFNTAASVNSLNDLRDHNWEDYPEVIIKAKFLAMGDKISCTSAKWVATIIIQDAKENVLEVSISNEILEELIGFSASTFITNMDPKKPIISTRQKACRGFSSCQWVISQLYCSMVLQKNESNMPCIVKLLEINEMDLQ